VLNMLIPTGKGDGIPVDLADGALPYRFPPPEKLESCLDVPKILHFIWIGSDVPEKYVLYILKFWEHNPDYEINLWMDRPFDHSAHAFAIHIANFQTVVSIRNVSSLVLANRYLYDQETNWAAKADILRYELVYQFGGIYFDVDTISNGPGSLHPDMQHSFVGVSGTPWNNCSNADFAFAKGSEFLQYVIENLNDWRVRRMREIPQRTGPTFFTTCVVSFGDERLVHRNGMELLKNITCLSDHNW
jgi:mannosyltransferase OCH1-like enzyme